MKYKIHVPTIEYGFIEQEVEGTAKDAVEAFKAIRSTWTDYSEYESLKDVVFNDKLDNYLLTTKMPAEDYESCTAIQKVVLQTIKRAYKRIQVKT